MENVWLWTADHDMDEDALAQITVYAGRGLCELPRSPPFAEEKVLTILYLDIESTVGNIWMVGAAVEHHTLYQYQFSGTQNIFISQSQTETP